MEAILEATTRETFGKNEARRTRKGGKVPGILYGGGDKTGGTPICVEPRPLLKILHSEAGQNTLIAMKLAGASDTRVLIKDFQIDPITHQVLHADFYRVAMDKVLQVTIPVVVKGEAPGVKQQAGVLEFIRREIVVECLPADIPESVEIDVSNLMLHQGIRVREIPTNPKFKFVSDPDWMLVHVIMPKAEEVATPAADGTVAAAAVATTPAEPEVIKKGKKEDVEGEKKEEKKDDKKKEDKKK